MAEIIVKVDDKFLEFAKIDGMEDQYELIRCKDCKYWSKQYRWCGFNDTDSELDDFCSWAERKEEK